MCAAHSDLTHADAHGGCKKRQPEHSADAKETTTTEHMSDDHVQQMTILPETSTHD